MKIRKNWKFVVVMTALILSLTVIQVFAAVAPSVSQKPAPKVVGGVTITDANGNAITISADDIKIVADGDIDSLSPEEKAVYEKAKAELTAPGSQYSKDLVDFLTKNFPNIAAENVVVRELFDISLSETVGFELGQKLGLTLDTKYQQDDTVMVIVYNKETSKWDFIETSDVVINADGTLSVNFPHFSPVAILVADKTGAAPAAAASKDASKAASDQVATGIEETMTSTLVPILVTASLVLAVFVVVKKKRSV